MDEDMRINLDEQFFSDKRIGRLALYCQEDRLRAEIRLIHVWKECYTRRTDELTADCVDLQAEWIGATPFAELLVRAFLAERKEDGLYRLVGVAERIKYLIDASNNGKKSAEARREKYGTAQPSCEKLPYVAEGTFETPSRIPEGRSKETGTSSSSSSSSSKKERIKNKTKGANAALQHCSPAQLFPVKIRSEKVGTEVGNGRRAPLPFNNNAVPLFIAAYTRCWQEKYGAKSRPDLSGAVVGQIKRFVTDRRIDDAINLIQVYLQMTDPWFVTKCHDFTTFMNNLTKVSAALGSGRQKPGTKTWEDLLDEEERRNSGALTI